MEHSISPSVSAANQLVYDSFEQSMTGAGIMRLLRATHVISELRERKKLLSLEPDNYHPDEISTQPEDSVAWEQISVSVQQLTDQGSAEKPVLEKYLAATYLRALSLVTDFLQNDKAIPVSSSEQNLNRALNRLILLEELETYLKEKYRSDIYA
jgi:hypothetical protein